MHTTDLRKLHKGGDSRNYRNEDNQSLQIFPDQDGIHFQADTQIHPRVRLHITVREVIPQHTSSWTMAPRHPRQRTQRPPKLATGSYRKLSNYGRVKKCSLRDQKLKLRAEPVDVCPINFLYLVAVICRYSLMPSLSGRKIKCSGPRICEYCTRNDQECVFNYPAKRRGPGKANKDEKSKKPVQKHVQPEGSANEGSDFPQSDLTHLPSTEPVPELQSTLNPPMIDNPGPSESIMLGDLSRTVTTSRYDGSGTEPKHSRSEDIQMPTRRMGEQGRWSEAESSNSGPDNRKRRKGGSTS